MDTPTASLRKRAQQLLALEAASSSAAQAQTSEAARVCEKLRVSLVRFAGTDGFVSLLRRALALARKEVPTLQNTVVKSDGSLTGLHELVGDVQHTWEIDGTAAIAIITHLLGLLVTFVGEPITLRLVREAWPAASFDE